MTSSGHMLTNSPDAISLDLRQTLFFLRRNRILIGGIAALPVAAVLLLVLSATPIYRASAQILLELPRENVFGSDRVISPGGLGSEIVDSQIVVLQSTSLLRKVIENTALLDDPEFNPLEQRSFGASIFHFMRRLASIVVPAETFEDAAAPVDPLTKVVAEFRSRMDVVRVGNSNVIEVRVESANPEKAAALANAVAETYVTGQVDNRLSRARRASEWLNERKDILQRQLADSEAAVEKFKIDHNLLSTPSGSITEQQLSELNLALINARADAAEKRSRYDQVQKLLREGGDVQTIPDVLKSTVVSELRTRYAELVRAEADLTATHGDRYPAVTKVRIEKDQIEQQINGEIQRVIGNLRNESEVAKSREASLAASLASVSGQSGIDNREAVRLRELERIAAANRAAYESLLGRIRSAEAEEAIALADALVLSQAGTPDNPIYPQKKLLAMVGLIFGLGLGVAAAAAVEMARPGFIGQREIEEALDMPVVALVPKVAEWGSGPASARLADDLRKRKQPRFQKAIDSVALGVNAMNLLDERGGAVQVTSAMPGEGKTVLAASLALTAAAAGSRTLLIDADLRRSSVTELFGLKRKAGLVDVLSPSGRVADAIHFDETSGLYIMPAGRHTDNPAPLLGSQRMSALLALETFDSIVIDTPPIAAAIDAAILSRQVTQTILAVRWNYTARETIKTSIKELGCKKEAIHIVLTMVDERRLSQFLWRGPGYGRSLEYYYHPPTRRSLAVKHVPLLAYRTLAPPSNSPAGSVSLPSVASDPNPPEPSVHVSSDQPRTVV